MGRLLRFYQDIDPAPAPHVVVTPTTFEFLINPADELIDLEGYGDPLGRAWGRVAKAKCFKLSPVCDSMH